MGIYRTHLIVDEKDSHTISKLKLNDVKFILKEEPSNCYWEINGGTLISHYSSPQKPNISNKSAKAMMELLIETDCAEVAENVLSLIHGGILLAYPEPSIVLDFVELTEYNKDDSKWYNEKPFFNYLKKIDNIGFGCRIASIAIQNVELTYAIEKFTVSLGLSSFTPKSADPMYGQVFDNYDIKHSFHTRSAFAIITAFSIIEELGLEVRSSAVKPRFINKETGEWNPKVLNNLLKRLIEANIDDTLTFDWIYRGKPTKIEEETKPLFGVESQWIHYHKDVRDKTLTFPEAIHHASYLRNFIASHKFNELTQHISPYDVNNVQLLARQLIIRKMNMWEVMLND